MQDVLGRDYCAPAPKDLVLHGKYDRHPTEIALLFGRRSVFAVEADEGRALDEAFIKWATGGDRLTGRGMREDFWDFDPTHKFIMCTNHLPQVRGTDHGIWRRLVLVPFNQQFWDEDKGETGPEHLRMDKSLPGQLKMEMPGILAWMVSGARKWNKQGLNQPRAVKRATRGYHNDENTIGQFVESCCETGDNRKSTAKKLYESYKDWCEGSGEEMVTNTAFGKWMKLRYSSKRLAKGILYYGISPRENASGMRPR